MCFSNRIINVCTFFFFSVSVFAAEPSIVSRDNNWTYSDSNTSYSGAPSDLHYYKYYDVMPDEIAIPLTIKRDLTNMIGKKIVVGYGIADPVGKDCRLFKAEDTGLPNDIKICLPWWRVERTYQRSVSTINDLQSLLCQIPTPKPPIKVDVCKTWSDAEDISRPGGKVTCTSYYDRNLDADCWNNPKQPKCKVDNCSNYIRENCDLNSTEMGDTNSLPGVLVGNDSFSKTETKIQVLSYQYTCPAGVFVPHSTCIEKESVLMFPYTCQEPTNMGTHDDGVYIYCDENKAQYDTSGKIIGFLGKCPDGREVMCETNAFSNVTKICTDPIMANITKMNFSETVDNINCIQHQIDVLSGETDIYAENPRCLRSNSIVESRHVAQAHIVGNGYLDDDIYVLKHRADGSHYKVYCNMQHGIASTGATDALKTCLENKGIDASYLTDSNINCTMSCFTDADNTNPTIDNVGDCVINDCSIPLTTAEKGEYFDCRSDIVSSGNSPKNYDGSTLFCISNNGNYSFDQTIDVSPNDIITIQEATEYESAGATPFSSRTHYGSTEVRIDGSIVAPAADYVNDYSYYPRFQYFLNTWENSLGTLTFMFPYAGAYDMYFYGKNGSLVAKKTIKHSEFASMLSGYKALSLIKQIPPADGRNENDPKNCWDDDWVEPGGGVHGGKKSRTGEPCYEPDDNYSKAHAIYNVVIKDLLSGSVTSVPLVYPIVYLNRISIARLKLYETRKYCCYNNFREVH